MHGISSTLTWSKLDGAPPLFATPRNPRLLTDGPEVAAVARSLGTPFLPWQQYVADVAGERRPDASYEYEIVIVSVPRQTGKTTAIRAVGTHRAAVLGRDVFYTAQTGKDARARWMDLVTTIRKSDVWKDRTKVTLRGGAECATFLDNAGFHVFAPTPESLHGYTPPTVFLDEAFALNATEGELLMGAIGPAQITIRDKQIWIVSTAGTADSIFLHDWIERAMGGMARVALFLWAAADDMDPYSLADIARFHPGVGFVLNGKRLDAADVLGEAEKMSRAEYERAFANRRTLTTSNLIPPATWRALADPTLSPPESKRDLRLAYDVALDRLSSTIVATWTTDAGVPAVKVVQAGPGVAWLADAVEHLDTSWRPAQVVAVGNGPVLEVTAQLRTRGVDVDELGEREYATASGAFLTLIDDRNLVHPGHTDTDAGGADTLETSVCGLVTRPGAVDGVAFSRRHSTGDSSAGIAATAGLWALTRDQGEQRPVIYFAS